MKCQLVAVLAAFMPVIRLTLVGELTLHAYDCVKVIPCAANRPCWVYDVVKGCFLSPKGCDVSCHPISSTMKRMMLGRSPATAPFCGDNPISGAKATGAIFFKRLIVSVTCRYLVCYTLLTSCSLLPTFNFQLTFLFLAAPLPLRSSLRSGCLILFIYFTITWFMKSMLV